MKIQKEKIKSLLYDFIDIQKDILLNESEVIKHKNSLKEFAINICRLVDFKDLDLETFNCLINKDIEPWSNQDDIDYSINNKDRYYRIEFNVIRATYSGMRGRITILNNSELGYYGYRVYFNTIKLKKEYGHRKVINGVRIDKYVNGKSTKSYPIKINRSFVTSYIYGVKSNY